MSDVIQLAEKMPLWLEQMGVAVQAALAEAKWEVETSKTVKDANLRETVASRFECIRDMEKTLEALKDVGKKLDWHLAKPSSGKVTILDVRFKDGLRIQESEASETFARVLDRIGAKRVADLNLRMGGAPLMARSEKDFQKLDGGVTGSATVVRCQKIEGGWFVNTLSDTASKKKMLMKISEVFDLGLNVEVVSSSTWLPVKSDKPANPSSPTVGASMQPTLPGL